MKLNPRRTPDTSSTQTKQQGGEDVRQILEKISLQLEQLESQSAAPDPIATDKNSPTQAVHKETVGQVLAQSQTKLTLELEATLASLQKVISESEKIASQIEVLLGESEEGGN